MSEYLDRPARTKEEALEDICEAHARYLQVTTNRVIKLTDRIQEAAK